MLLFLVFWEVDHRGSCYDLCQSVLPMFSSRSFIVSGLTFRSLIHFEFIFVWSVRKWSSFILLQVVDQFSQHHFLKRLSLLHLEVDRKRYHCELCLSVLPMFSTKRFILSDLTFRFLIHFELSLFFCMVVGSVLMSFFTKLQDTYERNQRQHKHMERYTMFFDWMNHYY